MTLENLGRKAELPVVTGEQRLALRRMLWVLGWEKEQIFEILDRIRETKTKTVLVWSKGGRCRLLTVFVADSRWQMSIT